MNYLAASATACAAGILIFLVLKRTRSIGSKKASRGTHPGMGLDVSRTQFWGAVLAVAVLTYLVVLAVTSLVVVAIVPAVVVATLPRTYFLRKRSQRLSAVQEAWPDGIRDLLSSVKSGSSLPNAIESLAVFGPAPLRDAFQGFGAYSRSLGVVAALELVKEDLADPTSDRVIEVLILAYRQGGSVVPEILADLALATTRDVWAMEQIRGEALEQKINSRIVFILPWVVLIAMTAQSGAFRSFYSTSFGLVVVAIGGAMSLVGIFLASRLASQPSEPRVFAGDR